MTDVSIILISYNDAGRLPRALHSALNQTLHNIEVIVVDDASTDNTSEVIARFDDPRLRSIRLERNSGGCSTPRNAGLDIARGTWVMFCDSDDELEMHAAKNLLLAVEESDADLGCGVAERVDVRTGKVKRWRSDAHSPGVIADLAERPGLIYDTICVNKIYRRSWLYDNGLRFVDDLLYEDQLFTMQCYLRANRIAIIDPTVYFWNVQKLSESITQRRDDDRNIRSRIAINRLIDAELVDRPDLRAAKDAKFLAHEGYLYLRTIERLDDDQARALLAPLVEYLNEMDLSRAVNLRPALRVAIYHLLCGDIPEVRRALRNIAWSAVIDMPIVRRDNRDYWGCPSLMDGPHVGGLPPEWWLDISALRASAAPIPQQRPCHVVDAITIDHIRGHTVDAYGYANALQEVTLLWVTHGDRIVQRDSLTWQVRDGVIHWQGAIAKPNLRGRSGQLAIELGFANTRNVIAVRCEQPTPFESGDFGTVRWRDTRPRLAPGERLMRHIAPRLGKRSSIVLGHRRPPDRAQSAALGALLTGRNIPHIWVQHPAAPAAPPTATVVDYGSAAYLRLAPITLDTPLPYALIAAHLAAVDAAEVRRSLDIDGPIVLALPQFELDDAWVAAAERTPAQVMVHRLDGGPTSVPAEMRAWVQDARAFSLAELLAICDACITDAPAMRAFIRSLGIPIADTVDAHVEPRIPQPLPKHLVAEGEQFVDRLAEELQGST